MNRNVTIVVVILILVVIAGYLVWLRSRFTEEVTPEPQIIEQVQEISSPSPAVVQVTASPSATLFPTPSPAKIASPSASPR